MSELPAISLFSGAGGLDLGVERAGYRVLAAVEYEPDAAATLKARAMVHPVPLQYVRPATYDTSKVPKQNEVTERPSQPQDEGDTRLEPARGALPTTKAGGYPWALAREPGDLQTCFIGISFYWDRDEMLATSLARVFNERGEGVIVRGGPAKLSKIDRTPYLPRDDAEALLGEALAQYRGEHRHLPARVAIVPRKFPRAAGLFPQRHC